MKRSIIILGILIAVVAVALLQTGHREASSHFTLWQLPSQTPVQHMSYVLRSDEGHVLVIDGGNTGDAQYLKGFLAALGNHVHAWFVSHPHPDHMDALTSILNNPGDLRIDSIYGSIPEEKWVAAHEPKPPAHLDHLIAFNKAVRESGKRLFELSLGQEMTIGGLRIEILGVKNPEIHSNAINNSSVVMRISDGGKSVLFLGDLAVHGGRKLLKGPYRDRLASQYVQMAHHGQNGVGEDVYHAIRPSYCLWPTPLWLWDNDKGGGKGSGPWQTLTVRQWMKELGVRQNYVSGKGLVRID